MFSGKNSLRKERFEDDTLSFHDMTISEVSSMTKIPSKCPTCRLEFPSINQMKNHKASAHPTPSKPPGPPMKAKDNKKKTPVRPVKTPVVILDDDRDKAEKTASPKLPGQGSAEVMSKWINGEARASQIASALTAKGGAKSASVAGDKDCQDWSKLGARPKVRDEARPKSREITLNESASLLENVEVRSNNSGPRVSTMRVFPPEVDAFPILGEGEGWTLRQRQPLIEPEPEKTKRERERYEDESSSNGGKKLDERSTPEEVRANTSRATANPRNLDNELAHAQDNNQGFGPDTQELMDVEFDSQSVGWDIEGHNVNLISMSNTNTNASVATQQQQLSIGDGLLSTNEQEWLNSATFSTIPPSPEGERNTQDTHGTQDTQDVEYGEGTEDLLFFKNAKIEELTVRLEEQMSNNLDHAVKVGELENKISELQAGVTHYRDIAEQLNSNAATNASKMHEELERYKHDASERADEVKIKIVELASLRSELERIKIQLDEKEVIAQSAIIELNSVKTESKQAMNQIKDHVEGVEARAQADMEKAMKTEEDLKKKYEELEGKQRAQIERLTAINKKALSDMGKMQAQYQEIAEVKAALVRAQGEKELEKLRADSEAAKAAKADDMLKKLEVIMKDTQDEKSKKENTNSALLNKIKLLTRQIPCERLECDFSCGKDHNCGTPTYRPRRRSRSRNGQDSSVPTTANLASAAGVPVERMSRLVSHQASVLNANANNDSTPATQTPRLPPRPRLSSYSGTGVEICRNFHYQKVCIRGRNCKYAHELIPANALQQTQEQDRQDRQQAIANRQAQAQGGSRAFNNAMAGIQSQPAPKTRSRSNGRQWVDYPPPEYHPDHPDYARIMAMRNNDNMGNSNNSNIANITNTAQMPAGNATGQSSTGASSVLTPGPQTVRPVLTSKPLPRSTSSATTRVNSASSEIEARRTIKETLDQQASAQAQLNALRDDSWRNAMDNMLNLVNRAFPNTPGERTPSRTSENPNKEMSKKKDQ